MRRIYWGWIGSALILSVVAWMWFSSSGVGEYADSPDGSYRANVFDLRRGTWSLERVRSVRVTITENSTGIVVWDSHRSVMTGESPPDYGDRNKKHIQWSPNSQSVSIPVGGPQDSVWVMP